MIPILILKKKNPNDTTFDWIKVVKRTPKEIKIKKEELEKFMPDEFVENLADADVNAFSIFRGERHDLKPTEVDYLDKGKRIIMDVGDEFLAQSINRDQAFNKLYKQLNDNIFMKAAVGISQVKRLGIVLDPVFTFTTGMAQEIFLPLVTKNLTKKITVTSFQTIKKQLYIQLNYLNELQGWF